MKTVSETDELLGFKSGSKTLKAKVGINDNTPAPTQAPAPTPGPTKTSMPMDAAQEVGEPGEPVMSDSDGRAVEDR